jgi:hypothetical protein
MSGTIHYISGSVPLSGGNSGRQNVGTGSAGGTCFFTL